MTQIQIKAMSVNDAYKGRRFKTKKYKNYELYLRCVLPVIDLPEPPYSIHYTFGVSNIGSDVDNPIKPFQDVLQKNYGFNDKDIFQITATKKKVEKGHEFIAFEIYHYEKAH